MTITLQIYDELRSNILYDLNDPTGTNSGLYGSVTTKLSSDFDIGSPVLQSSTVQAQDIDATYSAFSKRAEATMKLKLIISGTSYDNLTTAVGTLANFLTQGCVMKYSAGGNTYFIDCLPSNTPQLLSGGELAIYRAAALFQTDIDVEVKRQPYLRGAGLTASTNKLSNPTLLRDSNADGTPDSWTILSTPTLTIDATQQSLHIVAGAASRGVTQDTAGASASSGQTWTMSAEVKVTSGTAALALDWRTAANANISTTTQTTTTATWARVSVSGTAPATTDHIRATIQSSGAAATFDVRNVQLELAASATSFRVAAQTVALDPAASGFAKMLPVYNPGTAPSPMTIQVSSADTFASGEAIQAFDYFLATSDGAPGSKYLSDFLNGPFYAQAESSPSNGWTVAFGLDTSNVAGTSALYSGSDFATISHTTDHATYNKRITWSRTTTLDCLRGRHKVYVCAKPNTTAEKYKLQLKWSAGGSVMETNDEFLIDANNNASNQRVLCDMGTIEIPENTGVPLAGVALELWTKAINGPDDLWVDYMMLVPQDNAAHVEIPSMADAGTIVTDGSGLQVPKDLGASDPTWTAGTARNNVMKLTAVNQGAGIGSTTTGSWTGISGGSHEVKWQVYLYNFIGTVKLEVANLTDNDLLDVNGASMSLTYAYSTASNALLAPTLRVLEELSDVYQPRVTITSYTSGRVEVASISVTGIVGLTQNQSVLTDPGSTGLNRYNAERRDTSGNYVSAMSADRVPFWVPPGLSLLWLESYNLSVGQAELPHLNARTLSVTPTVYPRYWG